MVGNVEISNYIRDICPKYFPSLSGSDLVVSQAQFKERSTYPIVKLDVSIKDHPSKIEASLIVKTAPKCEENIEGLTEYNNMALLKSAFKEQSALDSRKPAFGFVNPLEYNHDLNVLVSEFVPHQRLSQKLFSACSYFSFNGEEDRLKQNIYTAGDWLRFYQTTNSIDIRLLGETEYYQKIESYIKAIQNLNLHIPVIGKIGKYFEKNKNKISKLKLPMGPVHGDFGPQNIGIGSNGKVYVFDLQRNYDECIYHDIAYFLVTLETLNPYPKHYMFSRKKALLLGKEFLLGYKINESENDFEWNDLFFHIYYLLNLMERVRKQCLNNRIGSRGKFSDLILKKYLLFTFQGKMEREFKIIQKLLSEA